MVKLGIFGVMVSYINRKDDYAKYSVKTIIGGYGKTGI